MTPELTWWGGRGGRHPLAPSISPGKTWEGWAGGAVTSLFIGAMLQHFLGAAGKRALADPRGLGVGIWSAW